MHALEGALDIASPMPGQSAKPTPGGTYPADSERGVLVARAVEETAAPAMVVFDEAQARAL